MSEPTTFTLRTFLAIKAVEAGAPSIFAALEAVSSSAIDHPEWKLDERRTWLQWERGLWDESA